MVIDTSAIVAIFLSQPERQQFLQRFRDADTRLLSAGNALETSIIRDARHGPFIVRELDLFVHRTKIDIVSVDSEQVEVARAAWRMYGKGRHPAGLNCGDCFVYALAKVSGKLLLATGTDFARTDVVMCV